MIEVTCRTKGCGNQDYTILLEEAAETVICGVCENEILDKRDKIV